MEKLKETYLARDTSAVSYQWTQQTRPITLEQDPKGSNYHAGTNLRKECRSKTQADLCQPCPQKGLCPTKQTAVWGDTRLSKTNVKIPGCLGLPAERGSFCLARNGTRAQEAASSAGEGRNPTEFNAVIQIIKKVILKDGPQCNESGELWYATLVTT